MIPVYLLASCVGAALAANYAPGLLAPWLLVVGLLPFVCTLPPITGMKNGKPYAARTSWALFRSRLGGYMDRFILRTPWGDLRLHRIYTADPGNDPHDHPFDFTSYILAGGYYERAYGAEARWYENRVVSAGDKVDHKAADLHRIVAVLPNTWTLVTTGPKVRKWGFHGPDGWRPYDA